MGVGFRVSGFGFWVSGLGFSIWGLQHMSEKCFSGRVVSKEATTRSQASILFSRSEVLVAAFSLPSAPLHRLLSEEPGDVAE